MRKIISAWFVMLTLTMQLVSCSEDEQTYTLSNDCYISGLSLGYARRTVHTLSSKGEDSTYTVTFNGKYYPMTIDQREGRIYNADSLPRETRTSAILATISASGSVYWRSEGDIESDWISYSATDSIDFSKPVELTVVSADGTARRIYTVTVNVHRQEGSDFTWMQRADAPELAGMWSRKALVADGSLRVWGLTAGGVQLASHTLGTTADWVVESTTGCENADVNTLQRLDGHYYMSTTDGGLLSSADGVAWEPVNSPAGMRLAGAGKDLLYALNTSGELCSSADGVSWRQETLDAPTDCLPKEDIASACYAQGNGNERLLLLGNRSTSLAPADMAAVVWSKSWRENRAEATGEWMYFTPASDNRYLLPQLATPTVVRYAEMLIACGGASRDGKIPALGAFYLSYDHGITWKIHSSLMPPTELSGTTEAFALAVDEEHFVWLLCGTRVWRGRLNMLGFEQQP